MNKPGLCEDIIRHSLCSLESDTYNKSKRMLVSRQTSNMSFIPDG